MAHLVQNVFRLVEAQGGPGKFLGRPPVPNRDLNCEIHLVDQALELAINIQGRVRQLGDNFQEEIENQKLELATVTADDLGQ